MAIELRQNITESDGALVKQYQEAVRAGNLALARNILSNMPNGALKRVDAELINQINNDIVAAQNNALKNFSKPMIVSDNQPLVQEVGDFWFDLE